MSDLPDVVEVVVVGFGPRGHGHPNSLQPFKAEFIALYISREIVVVSAIHCACDAHSTGFIRN
jgi:hypothetical protein